MAGPAPCPPLERLEELVSGRRPDECLRRHLDDCPSCRHLAAELRANNELIEGFVRGAARADRPGGADALAAYEIGPEIHRGGQGIVYEAVHRPTKRRVALKMLKAGALVSERQRRRFEREIELVAAMRHPGIVTLYDSGTTAEGRQFFAMEFIPGVPLDEFIRRQGDAPGRSDGGPARREGPGLPVAEALALFCRVCDAVQYAHHRGVIHRDLKPGNILVDAQGQPHVLDFGVAKALGDRPEEGVFSTQTGEFMGTFAYAAPEQVEGHLDRIDTRTDVYSLGVILYEMLAGAPPYDVGGAIPEVVRAITEAAPPPPSARAPGLGDELDTIVLKALEKERERRYQSPEALRQDIQRLLRGDPIDAKRDSTWYVFKTTLRRHRVPAGVAAAFLLLVATFSVFLAVKVRETSRERDKAVQAEQKAARTAAELAATLAESNIERGRLMCLAGNLALAEELIWREFLVPRAGPSAEDLSPSPAGAAAPDGSPGPLAPYWALWELYAAQPCLATVSAHRSRGTKGFCLGPDGRNILSFAADGSLRVWPLPLPSVPLDVPGAVSQLASAGWHDDGRLVLAGEDAGALTLWKLPPSPMPHVLRPLRLFSLPAPQGGRRVVQFERGATRLLTWGDDTAVHVWDTDDGREIAALGSGVDRAFRSAALSPDGRLLASGEGDERIRVWDLATGRIARELTSMPAGLVKRIAILSFSPDGTILADGWGEGTIEMWDLATGELLMRSRQHVFNITSLKFSPDGRRLLSGSQDKSIMLWDVPARRRLSTFVGHAQSLTMVRFAPGGGQALSSSMDGTIKSWDLGADRRMRRLSGHEATIFAVAFSPDGRLLASTAGDEPRRIRLWDTRTGECRSSVEGHADIASGAAFSADGRTLATAGYDAWIKLWDVPAGGPGPAINCRASLPSGQRLVFCISISPDGRWLVSGGADGTVKVWEVDTLRCAHTLTGHADRVPVVCISPDSRRVASGSIDKTIRVWDIASGRLLRSITAHRGGVRWARFGHDGRTIISCGDDATARLWDVESGRSLAAFTGHDQDVFAVDLSPDGRLVATATRGGTIKLWSARTSRFLTTLADHQQGVFSIAFSPDGRTLASGGEDRMVRLWDLGYFERHIAGNLEYQAGRLGNATIEPDYLRRLRDWAASVLAPRPPD
jgi:WD40 repeat protein/serine/threonine protein kinase